MPTGTVNSRRPIADESSSTHSVRDQLLDSFKTGEEYRHAFVEEKVRTNVAAQIKAIREQRKWTQPELAQKLGKSQSWISRLEDPNQPVPTVPSLLAVAQAFDIDLDIRFGRFSELLLRLDRMTPESLEAPDFNEELNSGAFTPEEVLHTHGFYLDDPEIWRATSFIELDAYVGAALTETYYGDAVADKIVDISQHRDYKSKPITMDIPAPQRIENVG